MKDLFTCEIAGYAMADRMTQELTAREQKRPAPGLIHHPDRGSQYCAQDYRRLLEQIARLQTA